MKTSHIFTLTVEIENPLGKNWRLFTSKSSLESFMKIQGYRGGGDSIYESADSLPLKLDKLLLVRFR